MPRLFAWIRTWLAGRLGTPLPDAPTLPPPAREPEHAPRTPVKPPYDLAKDSSTDNQKYLM